MLTLWGPIWNHIHGSLAISELNELGCENDLVVSFLYVLGLVAKDEYLSYALSMWRSDGVSWMPFWVHCFTELEWLLLLTTLGTANATKMVSDGREKYLGEFCVMHQEHTSSHFHQQKQFWRLFFTVCQCMFHLQHCSCRFWWMVVLFFWDARNSKHVEWSYSEHVFILTWVYHS